MTLTHEDTQKLKAPFKGDEHEFLNGNVYIRERAITDRLDEVDPNWTWERLEVITRNNAITFIGRLMIAGVWRDGVGMAQVAMTTNGAREANEAEKSAATDALKRAARLFGCGRYLLDTPNNVTDYKSLAGWLGETPAKQATSPVLPTLDPNKWGEAHWNALVSQFGGDLVASALKVERGGQWKGTYAQAKAAIEAIDIPM